jgi:hypothetical protein
MRTVEKTVYKFDELSDKAKEAARDWFRRDYPHPDWWDHIYEDAEAVGKILGVTFDHKNAYHQPSIWFNGFYDQGSGSAFDGTYSYAKGCTRNIRVYAPQDKELHRIADALVEVQRKSFYKLSARCSSSVRSNWLNVEVFHQDYLSVPPERIEAVEEALRDFNGWIFKQLQTEYEYLMSDEQVDESILANDYEFDEFGVPE